MGFNFVDLAVLVILVYFVWQGYLIGLLGGSLNLLTTIVSILAASFFYPNLGHFFQQQFSLSDTISPIFAFFVILLVLEISLSLLSTLAYKKIITPLHRSHPNLSRIDHVLGILPFGLAGALLLTLFLLLFVLLPISEKMHELTIKSWWGRTVVSRAVDFEPAIEKYLNRLPYKNLVYLLTPSPTSQESVDINIPPGVSFEVDQQAEEEMLELVNKERTKKGLKAVQSDKEMSQVGRKHCLDMFERSYFSHYTPEGKSPFDRIRAAGIKYTYAGENLAYAPSVEIAHQGLMSSLGHRENILRKEFGRLGIGVIDGGLSGKTFCQEFRD